MLVQTTLKAEDINVQRKASTVKEDFTSNFENLLKANEDLIKCLTKINPNAGRKNDNADLTKVKKAASELNFKLNKLMEMNQFRKPNLKSIIRLLKL